MIGNVVAAITGAAVPPQSYYLAASTNSGASYAYDCAVDSSLNTYITGVNTEAGTTYTYIAKYDSTFTNSWKRRLNTGTNQIGSRIGLDSSGNAYIAFSYQIGGLYVGGVAKYNSSGTIQWQRKVTPATQQVRFFNIAVSSSGDVFVIGDHTDNGDANLFLLKYNSSGTLQWQRDWSPTYGSNAQAVAVDSTGNVYVAGYSNPTGSLNVGYIMKFNSSGTKQWHRTLTGTATTTLEGIAVNDSNVYFCGRTFTTDYTSVVGKYNSSGTLQWHRTFNVGASSDIFNDIKIDASENVYVSGMGFDTNRQLYAVKYNSSGTIQWQRKIRISGKNIEGLGNDLRETGFYIAGDKNKTNDDAFFSKIPTDGTKTGTYTLDTQSLIYEAGTGTDAAGALTDGAGTSTINTSTKTDAANTLTDSAMTSTDTKVQL